MTSDATSIGSVDGHNTKGPRVTFLPHFSLLTSHCIPLANDILKKSYADGSFIIEVFL